MLVCATMVNCNYRRCRRTIELLLGSSAGAPESFYGKVENSRRFSSGEGILFGTLTMSKIWDAINYFVDDSKQDNFTGQRLQTFSFYLNCYYLNCFDEFMNTLQLNFCYLFASKWALSAIFTPFILPISNDKRASTHPLPSSRRP